MTTTKELDPRITKIATKIRELRKQKGYKSYVKFAEEHKLARMQYWRMETGINFTVGSLLDILDIHKISLKDFFNSLD